MDKLVSRVYFIIAKLFLGPWISSEPLFESTAFKTIYSISKNVVHVYYLSSKVPALHHTNETSLLSVTEFQEWVTQRCNIYNSIYTE